MRVGKLGRLCWPGISNGVVFATTQEIGQRSRLGAAMSLEPVLGLVFHLFSTPRHYLDVGVACGIVIGTVVYMTRIAGISVSYGIGARNSDDKHS